MFEDASLPKIVIPEMPKYSVTYAVNVDLDIHPTASPREVMRAVHDEMRYQFAKFGSRPVNLVVNLEPYQFSKIITRIQIFSDSNVPAPTSIVHTDERGSITIASVGELTDHPPVENELTLGAAVDLGYTLCGNRGDDLFTSIDLGTSEKYISELWEKGDVFLAEKICLTEGFPGTDEIIELITRSTHEQAHVVCEYEDIEEIVVGHTHRIKSLLDDIRDVIEARGATKTFELTKIKLVPVRPDIQERTAVIPATK